MSELLTTDEQREIIFKHIDLERTEWRAAKHKADRDDRRNAAFNLAEAEKMQRIDELLDAYIELDLLGDFVILGEPDA